MPTSSAATPERDADIHPLTPAVRPVLPATIALLSVAVFVGKWVFAELDPLRSRLFTGDVLTLAWAPGPLPYYSGWITLTGVLSWIIAGAAAVLAGWVLRRTGRRREGSALLVGGLLSIALGVDDLYLIHEAALSTQGVPEWITIGVLVAGALIWGAVYFREILRGPGVSLVILAAVWFGLSLVTETIAGRVAFLEEPTKTAGIICWAAWLWLRSVVVLRARIRFQQPDQAVSSGPSTSSGSSGRAVPAESPEPAGSPAPAGPPAATP